MAVEVTPTECRNRLYQSYNSTWKFEKSILSSPSVKTAVFSPISGSDVTFYFEVWYKEFRVDGETVRNLKICLVKSCGVSIPRYMKMNMKVSIYHFFDGSLFREYKQDSLSVDKMGIVTVVNEIFKSTFYENGVRKTRPNVFINDFNLSCSLMFYDHFSSPANYYKNMRSLKNLQKFATDFSCLYQSGQPSKQEVAQDVGKSVKRGKKRVAEISPEVPAIKQMSNILNDLEIKVGNLTFFAHTSVLAAHSPVFFKMLCNESKTEVITISDFSPETFGFFLKYLYSGEIEDKSWPTVKDLYALADKYDVRTLLRDCGEISSSFLSVDTVCEILKVAYDYRDDHLKLEATKFAFKHIKELLPKAEWKEITNFNPHIGYEVMKKYAPKLD